MRACAPVSALVSGTDDEQGVLGRLIANQGEQCSRVLGCLRAALRTDMSLYLGKQRGRSGVAAVRKLNPKQPGTSWIRVEFLQLSSLF